MVLQSLCCCWCLLGPGPRARKDAPTLYKTKCLMVCHAADGSAAAPPWGSNWGAKDLRSDEVQKLTDAQLNDNITNGVGKKMPSAYKDKLTADQIKDLVGYIRELGKKK